MLKRFLICFIFLSCAVTAQSPFGNSPLAHTFSIVARDAETGEMGVAVQSHWFSVGSIVSWGEAGVGVIATQSFVNASFGPRGLELMKSGLSAQRTLNKLIEEDAGRDFRQVAILDVNGNVATYTGAKCIQSAGHITGEGFSVQANMMLNNRVVPAMEKAFKSTKAPLAERLIAALEAAQNAGGDIRGQQSAAIIVVKGKSTGEVWKDRIIDLRVEDNPNAVREIKRVLKVYRAYDFMNKGDLAVEHGDMPKAMEMYSSAEEMFPENIEMKYWHAVTLANNGKVGDSLPLFKAVFEKDKNWKTMTPRLIPNGLLTVSKSELREIMRQ